MSTNDSENITPPHNQLKLRPIGNVYLPKEFADLVQDDPPIRLFGSRELNQFDRIFSHLRRGGLVVVSGSWNKILDILGYLEKKKREFSTTGARLALFKEESRRTRPWYERHYQEILSHIMVIATDDNILYIDPTTEQHVKNISIPYLLEFLGESPGANNGLPFLVPVPAIQAIQSNMKQRFYISALDIEIMAHSNVLSPISQDTIELFQEALQDIARQAPSKIEILDMGCGCGVLSLLAARIFASHSARIKATDILPEAIATTKLNVEKHLSRLAGDSVVVETTNSGDLFEPLGKQSFDLIIFNAPWVVSRPRSRAEIAIYDENQDTVRRFLMKSPEFLNKQGLMILGYSDHSGPEALKNLEGFIRDAGLRVENVHKRRIQSRRGKRKWETIMVYDIRFGNSLSPCGACPRFLPET